MKSAHHRNVTSRFEPRNFQIGGCCMVTPTIGNGCSHGSVDPARLESDLLETLDEVRAGHLVAGATGSAAGHRVIGERTDILEETRGGDPRRQDPWRPRPLPSREPARETIDSKRRMGLLLRPDPTTSP